MTETQQRFLRAVSERIAIDRIAEVRLFPAIRQGPVESAVAVLAVEELPDAAAERVVPLTVTPADLPAIEESESGADLAPRSSPLAPGFSDVRPAPSTPITRGRSNPRLSILTARYRLTIKGPDRGKWDFELVHDADAPLETVERVVHGVLRRMGEEGVPDLLSRADVARAVTEPWWSVNS